MYSDKTVIQNLLRDTDIAGLDVAVEGVHFFNECEPRILEPEPEERIIKTACRACIANCGVLAHVKNGRVVKLE
ncbi:MAG: hypothetical protein LUC83_01655, partial [Clostridiales bacterium]|nr:hypothetical protein [Clostridiales bacterium]